MATDKVLFDCGPGLIMKFSREVYNKAIKLPSGQLAWQFEYLKDAINEPIRNKYAILGGDVLALDKNRINSSLVHKVDYNQIFVGILEGLDGNSMFLTGTVIKINLSRGIII